MSDINLPSYSVLMSVYAKDNPEHFDTAIRSMAVQTVPFSDMVIVCDGPLSQSLEAVLKNWQRELGERLTVHRLSKNSGLGVALASGIPLCGCDVIARMDSDDISRPNRCELLLKKMTSEKLDLVGGAIEEFDCVPGDMGLIRKVPLFQDDIDTWLKERNPFNHMSVVFDRHMVNQAGGYEPFPWMEDYWLWVRMIAKGCRCANIPDVVVDVRVGNGMFARRKGIPYMKSQVCFFSELHKLGFITRIEQAKAVILRQLAAFCPERVLKGLYQLFLRKKKGRK